MVSTQEDPETSKIEDTALGYDYVQARTEFRKRADILKMNLRLAYTLIFSNYCDTALKHNIESREEFSDKLEGSPYELLAVIKEIMLSTSSQRHVSPYEALWSTMAQLFKLKQKKNESLQDYFNKMKAFSEQSKKYFSEDMLNKFVQGTDEYQELGESSNEKVKMEKGAWIRFITMGVLMNADKDKYGSLVKNFSNDYANQQDDFPVTLMSMRERMYYENKDVSKKDKKHKDKQVTDKKDKSAENVEFATSFAQIARGKMICFICGGPHYKNDCPLKDSVPKEKWVINQMISHFQSV